MPTKLQVSTKFLQCRSFSCTIIKHNKYWHIERVFPNEAKIALTYTFSKIFGKVLKNNFMNSENNYFSPHLSGYRASCT